MTSLWDELGLPPTRDAKAIRRAYAARLKRLDPDNDLAGFQRLRRAYEAALEEAARPVPATVPDDAPEIDVETDEESEERSEPDENARPMPPPMIPRYAKLRPPPPKPREPRRRANVAPIDASDALRAQVKPLLEKLEKAMADFDATRAVQIFDEAMAKGLLPLTPDPALVTRLSKLALYDQALSPETFGRLMRQFGWHVAGRRSGRGEASLASGILARLEAEGWYSSLVAEAAGRGRDARVARMLLGRKSRYLYYLVQPKLLSQKIAQYDRHKFWLSSRFDAKRIDSLRRNQAPKEDRMSRATWWVTMAIATIVTGLVRTCMDAMPPMH